MSSTEFLIQDRAARAERRAHRVRLVREPAAAVVLNRKEEHNLLTTIIAAAPRGRSVQAIMTATGATYERALEILATYREAMDKPHHSRGLF